MSTVATSQRLRAAVSIWSLNANPKTPMGMVPTITYQPMRASMFERNSGVYSERVHIVRIRQMSWRK